MKRIWILLLVAVQIMCLCGCRMQVKPVGDEAVPTETKAWQMLQEDLLPEATEVTEPATKEEVLLPVKWTVNGYVSISLWSYPGGSIIDNITKGETVELLGWEERYAKISYNGTVGYVLSEYIMPADSSYFNECLDLVKPANLYTYWDMMGDIETLKKQYPRTVSVTSIGASESGRDIPVLRIGNLEAEYHVLLQGSIHGREYLTTWLLMAMVDYWLDHGILSYGDVCYHVIPMMNPDGVIISQTQTLNNEQREIFFSDRDHGYTTKSEVGYAAMWKANGKGVDLNRNFSSGWEPISDRDGPSSERYKGVRPFTAVEAVALRDYTLSYSFDATLSYHSSGSIIYYEYGNKQPVNSQSKSLGAAVNQVTGYYLTNSSGVAGAGYKDWVMEELGIPSLTIEIGVGDSPLDPRECYSIFVRNLGTLPAVAQWLQQ